MLSEVDRQLKKTEAAERRRMLAEKAAMESQVGFLCFYSHTIF